MMRHALVLRWLLLDFWGVPAFLAAGSCLQGHREGRGVFGDGTWLLGATGVQSTLVYC